MMADWFNNKDTMIYTAVSFEFTPLLSYSVLQRLPCQVWNVVHSEWRNAVRNKKIPKE